MRNGRNTVRRELLGDGEELPRRNALGVSDGEAPDPVLLAALSAAAESASSALHACRPESAALQRVLQDFVAAVKAAHVAAHVKVPPGISDNIQKAVATFRVNYDSLRDWLDSLATRAATDLSTAFADLERDSAFVTIMLFGQTMMGKSTTMEALTGGDGASIGVGRQHTTRDIRAYYYPRGVGEGAPGTPALRIVDTPGIEGFEGDDLAKMAEEFIERSDHILFLLTNDKISSEELERFGAIRTQGKDITVLLNVKACDENLDLLVSHPEYVFEQYELDGHIRRISNYLEKRFSMPPPRVIPFHARAAWLGTGGGELPDGAPDREALRQSSRLPDVEERIREYIRNEARLARIQAPRDLLLAYLVSLKDQLRLLAGKFRQDMRDMDDLSQRLRDGTERARERVARRFPLLLSRFRNVEDAIPSIIDEIIVAGGRGRDLNRRWRELLQQHGVADAVQWFVLAGQQDFYEEVGNEVQAAFFDYKFTRVNGLDKQLGEYYEMQDSEAQSKYARAALRASGGVLAWWAATNWWNPTGWLSFVGAALAGVAGERLARVASDKWRQTSKKELSEKRSALIDQLRDRLWADYHVVHGECSKWLDSATETQWQIIQETTRPVTEASHALWQAVKATLDDLDDIAERVNKGLIDDLFAAVIPECANGSVEVVAVAREVGCQTTVSVRSSSGDISAVAACIGRRGTRIRRIADALGDAHVRLIDADSDQITQVFQALGLRERSSVEISLTTQEGQATAWVRLNTADLVRRTVGIRGVNVRLAKKVTGLNIVVLEK